MTDAFNWTNQERTLAVPLVFRKPPVWAVYDERENALAGYVYRALSRAIYEP